MSNYPNSEDVSVDRRQETVVTQQPGYAATEQVTRDVASEKRQTLFQINRVLYTLLGGLEILLAARFVLKLIGANPGSGFAAFIYGLSGVFVAPFNGLIGTPATGGTILEVTTLIAMIVFALIVWGIVRIIPIVTDRPSARTVTRTTREQTPGGQGNERTTRTITKD